MAVYSTAAAIQAGQDPAVAIGVGLSSIALAYIGGAAGAAMIAENAMAAQLVGGMLSTVMVAGLSTAASGGDLGQSIAVGLLYYSAGAAFSAAIQGENPVSQGSAARQQGGGGEPSDLLLNPKSKNDGVRDQAWIDAIRNGDIERGQIGKLPVEIYGGTLTERQKVLSALMTDLTKTQQGQSMLSAMEARTSWTLAGRVVQPLQVILTNHGGSYTYLGSNIITIDTHQVTTGSYATSSGTARWTYQRVLAHEMGHAAMGVSDAYLSGYGANNQMANVIANENRLMNQLGDFNDRIRY